MRRCERRGFKGIGSALSRDKAHDFSGIGAMAVKVMTDSKQQTAKILGRKWRKLMLTAVMVSGESRAAVAVGAEVLVHLWPFSLNSMAYKSIEVTPTPPPPILNDSLTFPRS